MEENGIKLQFFEHDGMNTIDDKVTVRLSINTDDYIRSSTIRIGRKSYEKAKYSPYPVASRYLSMITHILYKKIEDGKRNQLSR